MKLSGNFGHNIGELVNDDLKTLMSNAAGNIDISKKGNYLLTYDKAPVELLEMMVIVELIQSELSYYKKTFKEKGINGLINN